MNHHLKRLLYSVSAVSALLLAGLVTSGNVSANANRVNSSPRSTVQRPAKSANQLASQNSALRLGSQHRHVHYQHYLAKGTVNVNVKTRRRSANLYNRPKGTRGARLIGTTAQLHLTNRWLHANRVAYLKSHHVYYGFQHQSRNYWIPASQVSFNLKSLKGRSHRLERALRAGEHLIGHSKYYEKGAGIDLAAKRFDCSEFVRWVFTHAHVYLGPTTFTQYREGRHVRASHMKRGDIFFFDDKDQGRLCHVGIYLGHHLFLHDSPDSNTGGVGVSSLNDPFWKPRFDYIVRRVI